MVNLIVELSKFTLLTLMVCYTLHCLYLVHAQAQGDTEISTALECLLLFAIDTVAFIVLYLKSGDRMVVFLYLGMMALFTVIMVLYHLLYPFSSRLLLNNTCCFLSIGLIMLARLDMEAAWKQFLIAVGTCLLCLAVPVMIRRMRFLKKLTWIYGGAGVVLLAAVFALARTSYGAKLSLMGVQPSEAIKITFVFFMASLLWRRVTMKKVLIATGVAALHVGILVLSRDLGSALIYFIVYLVMIYTSTRKVLYLGAGIGGGAVASVAAYHIFGHVQERISAWRDPMAVYENEGYQIVQSLFAIGTGGWFGMGLYQGSPQIIPIVKNDFIFSAICEELGVIFAICLILLCLCFFMMILNIALEIRSPFYKLIALGIGTLYATQVFLTIGGAMKFIPLTGVTLPLVSYGGSSLVSTLLMLSIIQGLYIFREDEDEEIERLRREALSAKNARPFFKRKTDAGPRYRR
ncbi:MAG: FtsW/RodA/SpoVE family cell cycle protein [Blautia sp.]|nr:FtsW/RodA/SpoVE family cell cycle protein [Blautia sp.]